jgi:hypothetical protein
MEAVRTSETSVDNHSTRQYNPEDSSEHHTRRRENLKSHKLINASNVAIAWARPEVLNLWVAPRGGIFFMYIFIFYEICAGAGLAQAV